MTVHMIVVTIWLWYVWSVSFVITSRPSVIAFLSYTPWLFFLWLKLKHEAYQVINNIVLCMCMCIVLFRLFIWP